MPKIFIAICFLLFSFQVSLKAEGHMKYVLVVGGAGYIGSQVNKKLNQSGFQTIVIDNLSRGNENVIMDGKLIVGNLFDAALLDEIFNTYHIEAVMHFAAFKDVGESVREPLKYYQNNVAATLGLLETMLRHNVKVFVFSSSAAIFGTQQCNFVTEDHPYHPLNPYGRTKLMVETLLKDFDYAYGLKYCSLRYFNAAGGDPEGIIPLDPSKESNLIPVILRSLKEPQGFIKIFGIDHPTPDGTCVRDYIHIEDLARAHVSGIEKLINGGKSECYNLGTGKGYSVLEVIRAVEKVTCKKVNAIHADRREGDPAILVASYEKAKKELGWEPVYSLEEMIQHAWNAMRN